MFVPPHLEGTSSVNRISRRATRLGNSTCDRLNISPWENLELIFRGRGGGGILLKAQLSFAFTMKKHTIV